MQKSAERALGSHILTIFKPNYSYSYAHLSLRPSNEMYFKEMIAPTCVIHLVLHDNGYRGLPGMCQAFRLGFILQGHV